MGIKLRPSEWRKRHLERTCGCDNNPFSKNLDRCLYQPFPDGWDYIEDVGLGQTRGEIFTPRVVVDQMLFPGKFYPELESVAVNSLEGSLSDFDKRIFEPAVGTGNFISTYLWHKIELAYELSGLSKCVKQSGAKYNKALRTYQFLTIKAVASIYGNDIDPGNLQVVKWRIFRDGEIGQTRNIDFWANQLATNLPEESFNHLEVKKWVSESIQSASQNWGRADKDRGVLDVLYYEHTRQVKVPDWLEECWKLLLDNNMLLFDITNRESNPPPGSSSSWVPGYEKVAWKWWEISMDREHFKLTYTIVPVSFQIGMNDLGQIEREIELLEKSALESQSGLEPNGVLAIFETEPYALMSSEQKSLYSRLSRDKNNLKVPNLDAMNFPESQVYIINTVDDEEPSQ